MTGIIDLTSRISTIDVDLIIEPWAYHSRFETGSDEGTKLCIYSLDEQMALYLKTRHRCQGAQHGRWTPRDPEDHYFDTPKREIMERRTVEAKRTLPQQLEYLKSVLDESTLQPGETPTSLFCKPTMYHATLQIPEWDKLFAHLVDKEYTEHIFALLSRRHSPRADHQSRTELEA
ncbi:hypothetical protein HYU22_03340 [Candidatus Woesearchaeota archaeon]|nr:hypothetical protein [Candidatus Woesearchaeota archaeon]